MTKQQIELKNCPFCGGVKLRVSEKKVQRPDDEYRWRVSCLDCGGMIGYFSTEAEAIAAWNRRTDEAQAVPSITGPITKQQIEEWLETCKRIPPCQSCVSEMGRMGLLWTVFQKEPFSSDRIASFVHQDYARFFLRACNDFPDLCRANLELLEKNEAQAAELERRREVINRLGGTVRTVALYLKDFCNESLPYGEMVEDAVRKADAELERLHNLLAERNVLLDKQDAEIERLQRIEAAAREVVDNRCYDNVHDCQILPPNCIARLCKAVYNKQAPEGGGE